MTSFSPKCGTHSETMSQASVACSTCGKLQGPEDKLCAECGTRVDRKPQTKQAEPKLCTGEDDDGNLCGYHLLLSLEFCPKCGTRAPVKSEDADNKGTGVVHKDVNPSATCLDKNEERHQQQGNLFHGDNSHGDHLATDGYGRSSSTSGKVSGKDPDLHSGGQPSPDAEAAISSDGRQQSDVPSSAADAVEKCYHGRSDGQHHEPVVTKVSSPVPCAEEVGRDEAGGNLTPEHSKTASGVERDQTKEAESSQTTNSQDGSAVTMMDERPLADATTGFSHYADLPFHEGKKTIPAESQSWDNSSSTNNIGDSTELKSKEVCTHMENKDHSGEKEPFENSENSEADDASAAPSTEPDHARQEDSEDDQSFAPENSRTESDDHQTHVDRSKKGEKMEDDEVPEKDPHSEAQLGEAAKIEMGGKGEKEKPDDEKKVEDENGRSTDNSSRNQLQSENNGSTEKEKDLTTEKDKPGDKGKVQGSPGSPEGASGNRASQTQGTKKSYADVTATGGVSSRTRSSTSEATNSLTNKGERVTVFFHVIVSDLWEDFDPQKNHIFLRCRPLILGGFEPAKDNNMMKFTRETDIGFLYEGKLEMERHLRNSGFHYKYVAKKFSSGNKEYSKNVEWEKVQEQGYGIVNRRFHIPDVKRANTGVWHRYDGVAYFPKALAEEGLWQRMKGKVKKVFGIKTFEDRKEHDAVASAQVFLPAAKEIYSSSLKPASDGKTTMEGYLAKIDQVMSTLRYQMKSNGLWVDESLVSKALEEAVISPILERLSTSERTVTMGLFLLLLMDQFTMKPDTTRIQLLCRYMLISPERNNSACADLECITSHFPARVVNKSELATRISKLMSESSCGSWWGYTYDIHWLYCVPLLHFLQEKSQPYRKPEPSSAFKHDEWWGVTNFGRRKDAFKAATQSNRFPQTVLEQLTPVFQVDPLFVRTLVASLELEPLLPVLLSGVVPVDVMAATLSHHLQEKNYIYDDHQRKIHQCIDKMILKLKETSRNAEQQEDMKQATCDAQIIQNLHWQLCCLHQHNATEETRIAAVRLAYLALDCVALIEQRLHEHDGTVPENLWWSTVKEVTKTTCSWLSHGFSYEHQRFRTLQRWDMLLAKVDEDLRQADLKEMVKKQLEEGFEMELRKLKPDAKLQVYLEQTNVAPAFADILNSLAFDALDEVFMMNSKLFEENRSARLVSLLSTFIEQNWPKQAKKEEDVVKFVVTWIPMVKYFKKFGVEKHRSTLSELAARHVHCALECVVRLVDDLEKGTIQIETLQLLTKNHERFLALVAAADDHRQRVADLLELRDHELQTYISTSARLDAVLNLCKPLFGQTNLHEILTTVEEVRVGDHALSLSEVCSIALPGSIEDLKSYTPRANPWKLPEDIHAILPAFGDRISSYIFREMFSRYAQGRDWSSAGLWRALHVVWNDVTEELQGLCQKLTRGTITLAETQRVFSMFRTEDGSYRYLELQQELRKLSAPGDPRGWVEERIEQFSCFRTIQKHVQAATLLLHVKKETKLAGNFADIQNICSLSHHQNLPINKVDRSMLRLCTQLEGITPQGISCLEKFLKPICLEFVRWLKEKMKDGMKELKVFVDLALISAGEEPMAIAKVNCFHAATVGYAPLIFMKKGEGGRHLLQQCMLVFANIAADPALPKKLEDSSRYLHWFQDVENSLGSVEKTCLSQVSSVNERGVFCVGRGDKMKMILPNVIQLKVLQESDTESVRNEDRGRVTTPRKYTYEELLDLQSRLMLVAGEKGKENVDRFITMMENLIRLGKTYVQLCRDGCVLFLDWTVEFLCDVKRPVCCVSEFASQGKLKGHRSTHGQQPGQKEDVEEFMAGVAGFLEQCHAQWLSYLDQKRQDYPELNVFTVEQLVFLQQQLIKMGSAEVSRHVYPMLSLLKADCSPQDLEQALQEAMDHFDSLQQQRQQPAHQRQAQQLSPVSEKEKAAAFMTEMRENGFSKGLALKALQQIGADDIAEGIAWCMNNEAEELGDDMDEEMDEEEESTPMVEEVGGKMVGQRLREWVTRTETITECAIGWLNNLDKRERGTTLRSLIGNLNSVWHKFLETVSSSGMDFLSLEHLGIILRCLAAKDQRQFKRVLPPNFKPGIPNLILCPKNEVLNAVTYMYMFPEEEGTALPQPDEVLLCTEHTTFQQVDIFLRRAFFSRQQKVHCLAFADSLDYDVGEKTEKKINEYSSIADHQCHLVVICTTENEYRARIVAALEKFRQPSPALSTPEKVRRYLRSRFAGVISKYGITSASAVDPESVSVRVVKSSRSGMGKTLYKQRQTALLSRCLPRERRPVSITIPLHGRVARTEEIAASLLQHTLDPTAVLPRIIHLDISYQVLEGVDHLLYSLLVLGCVTDSQGQVWLRSPMDLYLVETMPLLDHKDTQKGQVLVHQIFDVLPSLSCWSPLDSLRILRNPAFVRGYKKNDHLFDEEEFASDMYQRPFRYLQELDAERQPAPAEQQGDAAPPMVHCLVLLLKYCGVVNPSWSEMTHFVRFLDKQLKDYELSVYCGASVSQDLPGFSRFVLRFLIQMSRDFATRSLKMSEESLAALIPEEMENVDIEQYEMRRTWESSPHPYIFFNTDGHSMTFLGFSIEAGSGNLVDHQTGQVLEQAIMSSQLYQILGRYRVPLSENFDILPREDRLLRLYRTLGLHDEEIFDEYNQIKDPDDTYELTTDNVKKILAIYMRFRCNIPVIVMGETGCGKTRLVRFLCSLQTPNQPDINTMVQLKVHGGTTREDIVGKVRQAEQLAQHNAQAIKHRPIYTVLFFDEANTTEAVGVIKEVMCDGSLDGQQMNLCPSLKMVAACNPYRKHSDELIERLENAGLGYHVDADKTVDKLGRVPMRRLVYRVQPLPQSMLPLVWDFGQLNTRVEELYIRQMVRRYVRSGQLADLDEEGMNVLCKILMESQEFMRQLANECSFVSLRDVDRALTVASWFLQQARESHILFCKLDRKLNLQEEDEEDIVSGSADSQEAEDLEEDTDMRHMTKALVLSLGVCYRACLHSKGAYDRHIIPHFQYPFTLPDNPDHFAFVIDRCQEVFLDSVCLADNIARNQALKENVFMMVVCIELRIPLFLVGKPGSSKSLAKTIVSDAMQGNAAHYDLFKTFKQAQMVSFQCSPLATAEGILGTFRQCAKYQEGKSKTNFVSVVVLDEVGLAEDSPRMPLKTLHPLLEDGCPGDEVPDDSKKVAFIGISNWALDPAKMNRGILVQRDVPDRQELTETARGICTTQDKLALQNMQELIPELAKAYLSIFQEAKKKREFFGLRDFYSLVKMVYTFAAQSGRRPSQRQLMAAIKRNFGGLDTIDPVKSFKKHLPSSLCDDKAQPGDPDCSSSGLIRAALSGDEMGGETRYLLLLTENYGGLSILSENLLVDRRVVPIFGSSFPKDQEYTQICRNINRIKVCMETGQTVILLNLENLYESLYDALNQYYAMLGGDRFVDLGLGTHRVKCKVHHQFRLIVVAEKKAVYEKFPIPLINRLEKHFLTLNNMMDDEQMALANRLESWAQTFVTARPQGPHLHYKARKKEEVGDVFMGYHADTAPAIVLKVWDTRNVAHNPSAKQQVLEESQRMLLWCATPDAIVRLHDKFCSQVYHDQQQHEHLLQYLDHCLEQHMQQGIMLMAQVTTHSKLLTEQERVMLQKRLPVCGVTLLSLQAFDTEQQFCQQLRLFFSDSEDGQKLLLVQCDNGDSNQNLIKGAQYCMQDLRPEGSSRHHVVFIIQLPRVAGACFSGFLGGNWHCLHIDDLRATDRPVPSITLLQSQTPGQLIMAAFRMETEEQMVSASRDPMQGVEEEEDVHTEETEGVEVPMEVDVTDVQLELGFGPSPRREAPPSAEGFSPQYMRDLFCSSIQAAVALVRDPEEGDVRATRRIAILLDLLEGNTEFFKGLLNLVAGVLTEREQQMVEAEHWLSKEAAKLETVKKAGTFRRSWMQHIKNKMVPMLAAVIAYLDTNHNLDLHPVLDGQHAHLHQDASPSTPPPAYPNTGTNASPTAEWVGEMWLVMLQEVCQLRYQHLRSMSDVEELEEFAVRHTGAGSLPFSSRLPFSWLLWEFVGEAICGTKSVDGDLLDLAGDVVDRSLLGRCIRNVLADDEERLQDMFQLYIADLLHFTFPLTPQLHQLLCMCVWKGLGQLHVSLPQLQLGRGVVALHILVTQMRPRLQAVMDLAAVHPDAVAAVQAGGAGGGCGELLATPDEMTQDVALLTVMVEELQPRPRQLDHEEGCQEWMALYTTLAPIILRILNDSDTAAGYPRAFAKEERPEGDAEEEEEASAVGFLPYGDKCRQQLRAVRYLWTRVTTLKLFLDFVGPLRQGPHKLSKALESVKLKLLCNLLGDRVDLKQAESLTQVDRFLKHANSRVIGSLLGKIGKCAYCETDFETAPVELPCKDRLCYKCYVLFCRGNQENAKCPQCKAQVPPDFESAMAHGDDRDGRELLGRYQRQISGFLMALVSQLCFSGKTPPEPPAITHIFGYIIRKSEDRTLQTKNMTVHDDLIDPTPVLRSFLLRLLLKHSETEVYSHLEKFLESAQQMVNLEPAASPDMVASPTVLEFCLLVIHCIEDLHHEQDAVMSTDLRQEERLLCLADTLHELTNIWRAPFKLLPSLYSLGRLRHALDACVDILHNTLVAGGGAPVVSQDLENLLLELRDVCQSVDTDWPKKFLVKQLCRKHGIQDFMLLTKRAKHDHRLNWIVLQESDVQVEVVADRYLVCGDQYKTLRHHLAQLTLDRNSDELLQTLQLLQLGAEQKETLLLLALHREVTMSLLYPIPEQARTLMADNVRQLIQDCDTLQDKALAQQLCDNQLGDVGSVMRVQPDQDLGMQSLLCVLTHLRLALRPGAAPAAPLLTPLTILTFQPAHMVNAFLPTMPQDNSLEVLAAIQEKAWQCPRGHKYLIGDCGRPVEEGVCPCGLKIGGTGYAPASLNVASSGADTTQMGHILGLASQRGLESVPERQLTSVECGILRFLLHAVLYLSASTASQAAIVGQMVTPKLAPDQAGQFFLNHLMHDVKVLQRCLGRSADDVFLELHYVCHLLACKPAGGRAVQLRTKEERAQWEQQFTSVFIAPVIQNMDTIVRNGNQAIMSDTQQGNSVLLKVVYEDEDTAHSSHHVHHLPVNPAVWRFRPPITVDHFFRQFYLEVETRRDKKEAFPLLRLFKAQRHVVQALYFVPAILRGQRRLMMQLHRRLDRAEAATLSIGEVMERNEHRWLEQLLSHFSKAWEIVKEHLIGFQCVAPIEGVVVSLPEEFHNAIITREMPVALLLPSMQGAGLCSYIFLQFILGQNNSFLDSYFTSRQRLPEVSVRSITERHLVGCSMERDLLPMVLSHTNYSLMVGRAATVEYDFEAFQQQLHDTLLQCKARVERSPASHFPVETMVYRADTTNSRLFKVVREKIQQECLSPAERRQIVEDLRHLSDITQSIDNLNTALLFLKALGGDPSTFLHDFMTKDLKMRRTVYSRKAQQLCRLTHVQSLWLVLCHQRALILAANQQDAFDSVDKELRDDMTAEQGRELQKMCQDMSVEHLELLLLQLFECIMLRLSEPQSQDEDARPQNFKLRDVLMINLEIPPYHIEPVEVRSGLLTPDNLVSFPKSLQGRHATVTWMLCRAHLAHKRCVQL